MNTKKDTATLLLFIIIFSGMALSIVILNVTYQSPTQMNQIQIFRLFNNPVDNSESEELLVLHKKNDLPITINLPSVGTNKLKFIFDMADNQRIGNLLFEYKYYESRLGSATASGKAFSEENINELKKTVIINAEDLDGNFNFNKSRDIGIKINLKIKFTLYDDFFSMIYFLQNIRLIQTDSDS